MLLAGGLIIAFAAFVGGVTGVGDSLVSTGLLILIGTPLEIVVTVNLVVTVVTRIIVTTRLRAAIEWRIVTILAIGSLFGAVIGVWVTGITPPTVLQAVIGAVLIVASIGLALSKVVRHEHEPHLATVAGVGMIAGAFGSMASLNGMPAALLMARTALSSRRVLATLAAFLLISSCIALVAVAVSGQAQWQAVLEVGIFWIPGALLANWLGTTLGPRLPAHIFRWIVIGLVAVAGAITVAKAFS